MTATNQNVFQSAREGVREFFLLEKAEQKLAALETSRRETVRNYYDAAQRRCNVAQDLRGPVQTPAALALYRQGIQLLALAYISARGQAARDPATVSLEETIQELDMALEADGVLPPAAYREGRSILVSGDPLDLDRLSASEAALRVEELEATSAWLSRLIDPRSPTQLKWTRVARIGTVTLGALLLLAWVILRITAPKNLARDKPATASSYMFSTVAAGAVDGSKNGTYGYHSLLEDSPWLTIDLGRPQAISRVKVFGRGDGYYDQSIPLALELSDDGTTYTQIEVRTTPFSEYDPWVVEAKGTVARFLKLRTMRQSYLVLGEVEVYGSAK